MNIPTPPPPFVCAWCPDFDPRLDAPGTSHGMCPVCAARFFAVFTTEADDEVLGQGRR